MTDFIIRETFLSELRMPRIGQSFTRNAKQLHLSRNYLLYSTLYGFSTLIIPFAVQFLVNKLALSGLWVNIFALITIITIGLTFSMIIRYGQFLLNEYLLRELFVTKTKEWKKNIAIDKRMYFIEIFFGQQSFSKALTAVIEIALTTIFGLIVLILFHPAFLIITGLIVFSLYQIKESTRPAIESSIGESDKKYELYRSALKDDFNDNIDPLPFLKAREEHFSFIRSNTIKIYILFVVCQIALLGGGTYLIEENQLSVGQLVAAEIILSGIMISLNKLPAALEAIYKYEASIYKIEAAKESYHA
jgi:MFS family permease